MGTPYLFWTGCISEVVPNHDRLSKVAREASIFNITYFNNFKNVLGEYMSAFNIRLRYFLMYL